MENAGKEEFIGASKGGVKVHYEGSVYRVREARKSWALSWKRDRAQGVQEPGKRNR